IPRPKVDGVELTEAEWRSTTAEAYRDQPSGIATLGSFVLDPGGFDGSCGPNDDDRFGVLERPIDFGGKPRTALNVAVPPDLMVRASDALRQLLGRTRILSRIA